MHKNFYMPEMKKINQAAEIAGLSKYFVRQLVLQQKIKYVKTGKKYLVNIESLIDYLNNGESHYDETELTQKIRKVGI